MKIQLETAKNYSQATEESLETLNIGIEIAEYADGAGSLFGIPFTPESFRKAREARRERRTTQARIQKATGALVIVGSSK